MSLVPHGDLLYRDSRDDFSSAGPSGVSPDYEDDLYRMPRSQDIHNACRDECAAIEGRDAEIEGRDAKDASDDAADTPECAGTH